MIQEQFATPDSRIDMPCDTSKLFAWRAFAIACFVFFPAIILAVVLYGAPYINLLAIPFLIMVGYMGLVRSRLYTTSARFVGDIIITEDKSGGRVMSNVCDLHVNQVPIVRCLLLRAGGRAWIAPAVLPDGFDLKRYLDVDARARAAANLRNQPDVARYDAPIWPNVMAVIVVLATIAMLAIAALDVARYGQYNLAVLSAVYIGLAAAVVCQTLVGVGVQAKQDGVVVGIPPWSAGFKSTYRDLFVQKVRLPILGDCVRLSGPNGQVVNVVDRELSGVRLSDALIPRVHEAGGVIGEPEGFPR